MQKRIIIFIAALLLWIILSWSLELGNIIVGLLVAFFVTFMTLDVFAGGVKFFRKPVRYLWLFYYIPVFVWECIKANFDGAGRVIHPDLPINPGIVKVKTTLKSDTGITFLANTLTLKPGTMTVDVDKENGFLYVHWVDVKTQDVELATKLLVAKFERILKRIFE